MVMNRSPALKLSLALPHSDFDKPSSSSDFQKLEISVSIMQIVSKYGLKNGFNNFITTLILTKLSPF